MSFITRERLGLLIGFIIGACLIVWFAWTWDSLGVDAALSRIAIVIAAIATLASLLSLRWARDTVRPFMSFIGQIGVGNEGDQPYMALQIKNTGILPASNVLVDVVPFAVGEEITMTNTSREYKFPGKDRSQITIFPDQLWQSVTHFDTKDAGEKRVWQDIAAGKVKIRIGISYSALGRHYRTTQSMHIDQYDEQQRKPWGYAIQPQSWC